MLKRIGFFILTNIAVIVSITIVIFIFEKIFGINISGNPGSSYTSIMIYSAIVGFTGAFISLFLSKWMAKKMYNVQLIKANNLSELSKKERVVWETVEKLSTSNKINMPEVGIYVDSEPNAFATGASRNSSIVCVSTGLLDSMSEDAIEGVVGHEMAHILNGDMVTMTLLQGVINTFVIFFARIVANIFDNATDGKFGALGYTIVTIILEILFGILALLITSKFSRYREYRADAGSAKYVGKEKMIAGLKALKNMQYKIHTDDKSEMATMQIVTKKDSGLLKLIATHPDLDDRIKALENLRV